MIAPASIAGKHVVILAGGGGGAKLSAGLAHILSPGQLTIIANTGDDFEYLGLHISPDLDTIMYTLSGLVNPQTGWGQANDTFNMLQSLQRYNFPAWFNLGDGDLATHLLRTSWLREGYPLSWVTAQFCKQLHIQHHLLPMSDDRVQTTLRTDEGLLSFQDYFVRRRWQPVTKSIYFEGIEAAVPFPASVDALKQADIILFGPSNPFVSLDPILRLPYIKEIISASPAPKIAVSPIVGGKALKGPAAKMMHELGMEPSAYSIAAYFHGLLKSFVLDTADQELKELIERDFGLSVLVTNTVMSTGEQKIQLATQILEFIPPTDH